MLTTPEGGDRRTVNDAADQPVGMRDLAGVEWSVDAEGVGRGRLTLPPMSWTQLVVSRAS